MTPEADPFPLRVLFAMLLFAGVGGLVQVVFWTASLDLLDRMTRQAASVLPPQSAERLGTALALCRHSWMRLLTFAQAAALVLAGAWGLSRF